MAIVKIVNAEGGSDARYDVNQMSPQERANFDGEGRPLGVGFPDQDVWTNGLPGARGGDSQYSMGGGGGGGGDNPYDAYTSQLQSMLQSQSAAQRSDARSTMQQLLIATGLIPQGFTDEFGVLDDTTKGLIQKNTDTGISAWARLLEGNKDAQNSIISRLGAKGLRRSGAKGYLQRRGQLGFDRQSQDMISSVLQNLGSVKRGFADAEQNRQMQMLNALFQSRMNLNASQRVAGARQTLPQVDLGPAPNWGGVATIGGGQTQGGYGTAYGPAEVGQGGGFTAPQKPIRMPDEWY